MATATALQKFQGPLDLLLQLIEQEKLHINEISLAHVTERFFEYLKTVEEDRPETLADFLVIATKLVYLKSRQLLPHLNPEAEDGPSLADQLKLYQRYAEASRTVESLWNRGLVAYGRSGPLTRQVEFAPPRLIAAVDLRRAMAELINRLKPIPPLLETRIGHSISVKEQIEAIYSRLKDLKKINFSDMLRGAKNRTEVIVSFLAILELVKRAKASIRQTNVFGEMEIRRA